jgi:hypothetical protein
MGARHQTDWPTDRGPEKDCADESQQQITYPSSHQKRLPIIRNPQLSKDNLKEKEENNSSRVPDGCLTPGQTGLPTVVRNLTEFTGSPLWGRFTYLLLSLANRNRRRKETHCFGGVAGLPFSCGT